jgi:sugar porter (SP) family MFS transporter
MDQTFDKTAITMDRGVFQCILIVAFTGFLMGFDSVLISGVNLPVKHLWGTSGWFHGTFIVSISAWGALVGALAGGYPTERFGRKKALLLTGILFTVAATGAALSISPYMFSVFRFIGGLAAGIGSAAAPTYIAEISNVKDRGKLGILFQINIVTGILMAFVSNYLLAGAGSPGQDWRWMISVMVIMAFGYTLLVTSILESPRWIASRNIRNGTEQKTASIIVNGLFSGKYRKALLYAFLIAFFNQFSGISFVLFYAPEILEKAGFGTSQSLLSGVSIGMLNVLATLVGMYLIDRIGRRKLMYVGSVGYIFSLSMIAFGLYAGFPPGFTLVFMLCFILSHAVGQGAVIWVFIAEIFPTQVRAFGQAWGAGWLNGFAALTTLLGSVLMKEFAIATVFALFAVLMVGQLLFTALMMPETKDTSLEELEVKFASE